MKPVPCPELKLSSLDDKLVDLFLASCPATFDSKECALWPGSLLSGKNNYGRVHYQNKFVKAHRLAFVVFCGDILEGNMVCHKCDTPQCFNPHHLFAGTGRTNALDMCAKGRHSNGRRERTACPKGHLYDAKNTYVGPSGKRTCRICCSRATCAWAKRRKEKRNEKKLDEN